MCDWVVVYCHCASLSFVVICALRVIKTGMIPDSRLSLSLRPLRLRGFFFFHHKDTKNTKMICRLQQYTGRFKVRYHQLKLLFQQPQCLHVTAIANPEQVQASFVPGEVELI